MERATLDGDADDGKEGVGGDDAGQVGRAAGGGDDDPDAALGGVGGEVHDDVGGAVRAHDANLGLDAQLPERVDASLDFGQVGVAAHENGCLWHGGDVP